MKKPKKVKMIIILLIKNSFRISEFNKTTTCLQDEANDQSLWKGNFHNLD